MLTVAGLRKRYDSRHADAVAVRDVGFAVAPGEFFTLLGPSGCGKTTTLRSIAGLETPDAGEITIDGRAVYSSTRGIVVPVARRDIAMVFQSYAIWPHMTVRENIAFPLEALRVPAAEARRRVDAALEMVGLEALHARPAPMLSGGQQQRVALARAIVKQAKLLLLDEPLSNLDAKLREQMRGELRELQRRIGTTAIYVTHDQDEALSLSDRIAVMKDGAVVELDTPEALYLRPRSPFTARFVGQADLMRCTALRRTAGSVAVETPLGPLVSSAFPDALAPSLSLLIRPEHVEIEEGSGAGAVNRLAGAIERVAFSGRLVEYVVRVGDARLRVQSTSRRLRSAGDQVTLHLPPERCVVLNDGA